MVNKKRDTSLDNLLDLNGQIFVIDDKIGYWVKFVITIVPVTEQKPHGLDYSLTLHNHSGERIMGFDNAHSIKNNKTHKAYDHKHNLAKINPYLYQSAEKLLEDFWQEVELIINKYGD